MAVTVPRYERSVADRPAFQQQLTTRATPDDFGASIGRGLQSVAQGMQQAGNALAQVEHLEDVAAAKDREKQLADWDRQARLGENGFLTLSGGAAIEGRADYERALEAKRRDLGVGLRPGAMQIYNSASEARMASSLESSALHVARERKVWIVDASNARASMLADDAMGEYHTPAKVEENIELGVAELRQQGALLGWPADVLKQKEETYRSAILNNVILRQAQDDPLTAAGFFLENADKLTAEDGYALWGKLAPLVKDAAVREATLTENGGVEFTDRAKALLDVMPADSELEIREGVATELLRQQTAKAAQAKVALTAYTDGVALGILTGDVSSEQTILGDPLLDDGDKATLIRSFRTEQNATAGAREFLGALGAGTAQTLNPYSTDDQALADKSFEMLLDAVTPEQRAAATVEFVTETQMIPKAVVADVRAGLNSTDGRAVAVALQQSAALMDAAPMAVGSVANGQEIADAAATYAEMVGNQGRTVDEAAKHIIEMRDPANIAKAEVLDGIWKQAVKDQKFATSDVLGAFGDNWLPGGPVAGLTPHQEASLNASYLSAAERALKGPANGDVGIARAMALQEIKRTYGVSRVSGQEVVTKYPPENFYPAIDGSQSYIRDLALKDARTIAPDASNVMLVPTPETSQDVRAGKPPRYNLMFQRTDGVWDAAPGLFMVTADEIAALAALASEERAIKFEGQREREAAHAAKGLPPLSVSTLPAYLLDMATPDPLPGDEARGAALDDVARRRNEVLGNEAAPSGSGFDPAFMDRVQQYQKGDGFGAFGSPIGGKK